VIRVLSADVANRIAAGEVVERPASVVKELVENALDAGARDVRVELEDGGAKLVRVVDDGVGMTPDDLARAVLPHATSKIADVDDLFRVSTYGFRGEALPSIGSVARLEITTRREGAPLASRLVVEGGATRGPDPVGAAYGTTVEVRNLFYNVPARRLFLKQERTEAAQALETLTRLALPDPEWSLRYLHQGRLSLDAPAGGDRRARLAALFGADFAERLFEAREERAGANLHAFFGPVDFVRPNATKQYLFLNGRWIRDRRLSHAIQEAYRGLVMPRDFPVAFLFLTVDPATVDVNVHPTKAEVRFRDPDPLHSLIYRTLRTRLDAAPGSHRFTLPPGAGIGATFEAAADGGVSATSAAPAVVTSTPYRPSPFSAFPHAAPATPSAADASASEAPKNRLAALERGLYPEGVPAPVKFLQIHRSYVVVESPDGLRILDQHALHERKLYDELRARFASGDAEDQLLLVPETVEPGPAERALLLEYAPEFARLGLRLEAFGPKAVALRSLPAALKRARPDELLAAALALVREGVPRRDALADDAIATMACKAAVKFNDALPPDEIRALLAYEAAHPEARNCPHGRNTALSISLKDLEVRFQRKK
jgi:DNA mismatch repair protein MutL